MTIMQVAEWAPDMPDLSEATSIATGVIALTPQSYGPLNSLVPFSTNEIDNECIGMGSGEDTSLNDHIFAGTTDKLYHTPTGAIAWTDVSGSTYAAANGENWRFAQYNNLMIATDFDDPIQSFNMLSGSTFAELSTDAPKARHLAVAKTFLITANTNDPVGGKNPARLWWSASGDPTNFPTPGSTEAQQTQSDYSDELGPQGPIAGLSPNLAGCDCAVFFARGVFRMIYVGPPDVFDFYPAAAVKGCPAPNSIAALESVVYYLAEDGFYAFDGNTSTPIGANKVDKWFFANVDQSHLELVIGAPDIANKAIIWIFKSIYTGNIRPDMMLLYRWDIQRWTMAPNIGQWISRIPVTESSGGSPPAVAPLVSGLIQLAAIHTQGALGFFNGPLLPAQVGTKVVQITPNARSFVNRTRPLVNSAPPQALLTTESGTYIVTEAGNSPPGQILETESNSATITVAMSARNTYQDVETFGPEVAPDISGDCPQRSDGRYHRGRITVPIGAWTTMTGLDVSGIPAGLR